MLKTECGEGTPLPAPAALRHVALRCRDLERSRSFYEDVIGWQFVGQRMNGNVLDLSDGGTNVTLIRLPADRVRPEQRDGCEYIHFGVMVDDLDAVWRRLRQWGAKVIADDPAQEAAIERGDPPEGLFKVLDPDGNIVDITSNQHEWPGATRMG